MASIYCTKTTARRDEKHLSFGIWCALYFHSTLRPKQDGRHFADDICKCIFLNENVWIPIKISLKFVPKGPINNIPAMVQIMAWRRSGDKPLSEPMMVSLPMHICITGPQWVNVLILRFTSILLGPAATLSSCPHILNKGCYTLNIHLDERLQAELIRGTSSSFLYKWYIN